MTGLEGSPGDQEIFSWWGGAEDIQKIYENYIQKIYESYIQSIFTFVDSPGDQEIFSWWGGAENIYFLIDFQLEIRKVS